MSLRVDITTETVLVLETTLPELNPAFLDQYRSAKARSTDRGPDWWTQGGSSMRKLLKGVLRTAAPNELVLPWAKQNNKELDRNGRPTRATKVEWLCQFIGNDAHRAYVRTELNSALALIDLLDATQHVDDFPEFGSPLRVSRCDAAIPATKNCDRARSRRCRMRPAKSGQIGNVENGMPITPIDGLLRELGARPVLVDIGATGEPTGMWRDLAFCSTYVGIGPQSEPFQQEWAQAFREVHHLNYLVTIDGRLEATFHEMTNPIYSSILEPHPQMSAHFVAPHLEVERHTTRRVTTLDTALATASVQAVDWIHSNANGIDIAVLLGLCEKIRRRVLAIDTVFEFIDLYVDQPSGVARYQEFLDQGFWLSRVHCYGPLRMRPESLKKITAVDASIDESFVVGRHRRTPGWMFAQFFRTVDAMADQDFGPREYTLLWTFSLLDDQLGFAADLMFDYARRFGEDSWFETMQRETVARFKALRPVGQVAQNARSVD